MLPLEMAFLHLFFSAFSSFSHFLASRSNCLAANLRLKRFSEKNQNRKEGAKKLPKRRVNV